MTLGALLAALLAGPANAQSGHSLACAGCHRQIWESYERTGMARSFSTPTQNNMPEDLTKEKPFYHRPSDSYFVMLRRGGSYFQRRYQLDPAGKETNLMEKRVDYILGSGNHSRAYLHRTESNALVELPLAWYAEKGGYWAMNPGYDRQDHDGFRRPITYDCIFCHNAYPDISPGDDQVFAAVAYPESMPEGIDCQRCHGPGTRHMRLAGTPGARREDIRNAIVNPARLPPERQMEICMACHLETTSFPLPNAIRRFERGPFSYQPGEPLGNFILNFDHAPGSGREEKFEIVSAAYRIRRSACFLKSAGKLLCTTCHDPHNIPRGDAAKRHYATVCRQCHASGFERQVEAGKHVASADCAGCHMPKRRTEDAVHVVMTDHYIQRHPPAGNLMADRPERQETGAGAYRGPVVLYYPETVSPSPENELLLAVAQVKDESNLEQGIARLTAALQRYSPVRPEYYLELGDALQRGGRLAEAVPAYRKALLQNPESAAILRKLGTALRRAGQYAEAADVLRRAAAIRPGEAVTWHELGLAYRSLGDNDDAIGALSKAIERDPDLPEARNNLGILWLANGDRARAERAFREAIRIWPNYADARGNLANLLAGEGQFAEARFHFETSLRLRPADAHTLYSYAMMLGRTGHIDEAQRELERAVHVDPQFADAHQVLGDLLLAKGNVQVAASEYREALRISPDSGRAHLGLGTALAASGDVNGARIHLQKAATGPDAVSRRQAAEMLRQLGK